MPHKIILPIEDPYIVGGACLVRPLRPDEELALDLMRQRLLRGFTLKNKRGTRLLISLKYRTIDLSKFPLDFWEKKPQYGPVSGTYNFDTFKQDYEEALLMARDNAPRIPSLFSLVKKQ